MSGRKRGEVTTALEDASKSRKEMFGRFDGALAQLFSQIEAEGGTVATEREKLARIQQSVKKIDQEIEALERAVKNKSGSHYFNAEYDKASKLLKQYKEQRDGLADLQKALQQRFDSIIVEKAKKKEQQQQAAQEKLAAADSTLSAMQYRDPRNPQKQISAQEFCQLLGQESVYRKVADRMTQAKSFFDAKKPLKALKVLGKIDSDIRSLRDTLDTQEIKLNEIVATGKACQRALSACGYYDMKTTFKNGNISEGIVIEAKSPQGICAQISGGDEQISMQFDTPDDGGCIDCIDEIRDLLRASGFDFNVRHWGSAQSQKKQSSVQKETRNHSMR